MMRVGGSAGVLLVVVACASTQSTNEFEPVEISPIAQESAPEVSTEPASEGEAPEVPSRDDVAAALRIVAGQVAHCGAGVEQTVQVLFSFDSSGHVRGVEARDVTADVWACVEPSAESARLPPFRRPEFTVSYPFRLR